MSDLTPARRLLATVTTRTRMPDDAAAALDALAREDDVWQSLSSGERAVVQVALSLEFGRAVNLRAVLGVMDSEQAELVVDAISESAGL